jgi:hypothetical protein
MTSRADGREDLIEETLVEGPQVQVVGRLVLLALQHVQVCKPCPLERRPRHALHQGRDGLRKHGVRAEVVEPRLDRVEIARPTVVHG